ncbi:MAG: hypothetical protein IJU39_04540 [Clostridia bacterium]|nr:hypothetical protein [Clostridia bacterium]
MSENVLRDLSMFETYDTSTSPRKYAPSASPSKRVQSPPARKLRVLEDTPKTKRERLALKEFESLLSTLKILAVAVACIVIVGSLVFQRVTVNDLGREITRIETKLNEAKSENVRLSLKLESLKTPKLVGDFAQSKGMIQRDEYTITYFDLSTKDVGHAFSE